MGYAQLGQFIYVLICNLENLLPFVGIIESSIFRCHIDVQCAIVLVVHVWPDSTFGQIEKSTIICTTLSLRLCTSIIRRPKQSLSDFIYSPRFRMKSTMRRKAVRISIALFHYLHRALHTFVCFVAPHCGCAAVYSPHHFCFYTAHRAIDAKISENCYL